MPRECGKMGKYVRYIGVLIQYGLLLVTLFRLKKIVRNSGDFVIKGFVILEVP